jgi:hypothetical protein
VRDTIKELVQNKSLPMAEKLAKLAKMQVGEEGV